MLIQGSIAAYGPPVHYINAENKDTSIPDCLKELVDYKNSQDYLMFKQLHMQLNSKYSRIKAYP